MGLHLFAFFEFIYLNSSLKYVRIRQNIMLTHLSFVYNDDIIYQNINIYQKFIKEKRGSENEEDNT